MKATTPIQPHAFNFSRYAEDDPLVTMTISKESELWEAIEAFETFLIAVGYSLPDGAHLGYEYDDETSKCYCDNFLQIYCDKHNPYKDC